jgi:hypothetical protein
MNSSFSFINNKIKGRESITLCIQGLDSPNEILEKLCTIKIYEVDTLNKHNSKDDLLAEFLISIKGQNDNYFFDPDTIERIDQFEHELPEEEYHHASNGEELSISLKFDPPHFYLFFDTNETQPEEHLILIKSEENEIEYSIYEIGFTIEMNNKVLFDSRKIPAYIDCNNLLAYNCCNAAKFIVNNHYAYREKHLCGLYYGSKFMYSFDNEEDYIRSISQINPDAIKVKGNWDHEFKKIFDSHNQRHHFKSTDCIKFVLEALQLGFEKTNMKSEWNKIEKQLLSMSGQQLAKALIDIGWIALFYAPDTNNFYDYDKKKEHSTSCFDALKYKKYGNEYNKPIIPIYDCVVNYSPTMKYKDDFPVENPTQLELDKINKVMKLPFAFLLAKYGRHTALLIKGKVFEVHWTESCYTNLFDTKRSFKYDFSPGTWDWLSGLIVTPKIFWEDKCSLETK